MIVFMQWDMVVLKTNISHYAIGDMLFINWFWAIA
jgi:hypothetical protein